MASVASVGLVLGAALVGCGGGGGGGSGPAAKPGTTNKTTATQVVTSTASMKTALDSGDGASLSANVEIVGIVGAQEIVSPAAAAQFVSTSGLMARRSAVSTAGPSGGTVDCTATGCVYNMYASGSGTDLVVLNGSVSSAAAAGKTTVTADLTIAETTAASGTSAVTYDITGSLDFGTSTIDGDLKSIAHYTSTTQGLSFTYDYYNEIKYNALTLTAATPTAGSIYAKWGITVNGIPGASQAYEGTVTYP
ncbi:MAG TPA: hypothetical protein VGP07_14725 [Polyangia bacterium]|jgi:hypothetical protein